MALKGEGAARLREVDRWDGGAGWIAYPEEGMERASHALAVDGRVWVVDPVDAPGVDDLLAEFGEVAGVVVGLDRHRRDAAALANRHGASVYLPEWMTGVARDLDAPVERYGFELADTGFRAIPVRNSSLPKWQEVALYRESDGTLVVPEAVGTAAYYRAPGERLGVHPLLRLVPPRHALSWLEPERVLVGHGAGVFDDATGALREALANARRRLPAAYAGVLRSTLSRRL
ncbi:MAG: hypothetical protein ABEJ28_00170 [Salinigranum sp.]